MRRLFPVPADDVDPAAEVASEQRVGPGRPWVALNMITSIDGATAIGGRSGGLGGAADRALFAALRSVADFVLVAAGTVRAEDYGPPRVSEPVAAARVARGQTERPRLAVVTRTANLDPDASLFDDDPPPVILTSREAPPSAIARLEPCAEVVVAGTARVDLARALDELAVRGAHVVVCEGGPSLNGQLVELDLIDEVNLSISPVLAAGDSSRMTRGATPDRTPSFVLARLLEADDMLFARYRRPR